MRVKEEKDKVRDAKRKDKRDEERRGREKRSDEDHGKVLQTCSGDRIETGRCSK